MKECMLLLSGATERDPSLSIQEQQAQMMKYLEWLNDLKSKGAIKSGQPLGNDGRTLSNNAGVITDSPFLETKEAIGGYFVVNAESLEAATEVAKTCPHLLMGGNIEVRPITEI